MSNKPVSNKKSFESPINRMPQNQTPTTPTQNTNNGTTKK